MVDFLNSETKEKFATGEITNIKETTFEEMVKDAVSIPGMYDQYKSYYNREIKPNDIVKWIDFELVKSP